MSPVTPEGYRVVYTFLAWMVGGALAGGLILLLGASVPFAWITAPVVFAGCAIYGAWYFISEAQKRGDHEHTVADYKAGRVP